MKKFVGITMAAVCALTACAFSFSGCNKASDIVTEEEWKAAMSTENALNVTVKVNVSMTGTVTHNGETKTYEGTVTIEAKTAFSKTDAESSEIYGNVTGNSYYFEEIKLTDGDEVEEETEMCYGSLTTDSYSYVRKDTYTGSEDNWHGLGIYTEYGLDEDDAYSNILDYMCEYADSFEDFEYSEADGAYVTNDNGANVYIKINDGYVTSIEGTNEYTESYGEYSRSDFYNFKYEFFNYGTTTVEIPEEYTYDYYLENHS